MKLDLRRVEDRETLELVDHVERRQVTLRFPAPVDPVPADPDAFIYPIDRAVSLRTDAIVVEPSDLVTVLDGTGAFETHVSADTGVTSLPPGDYLFSVSSHVKTYLAVEADASIEVEVAVDGSLPVARLDLGSPRLVQVGVRSVHDRPAATVTTTRAPSDLMTAVSALGSALKDLGPDRSFPSLRGHPPELELGEALDVPDCLAMPETGVTIEVPPAYTSIFPVAPLVYYLGAVLVPGDRPRLRTDAGLEVDLDGPGGFERTVERVLRQVFTCDCYVRSAGPFSSPTPCAPLTVAPLRADEVCRSCSPWPCSGTLPPLFFGLPSGIRPAMAWEGYSS